MQREERVENLFLSTQSLIRGWKNYFHKVLKPEGLSPTLMSVLFHIGANQPVNGRSIGAAFHLSPSAVSQLIDGLYNLELIIKETSSEDRRATYYSLSNSGKEKLASLEKKSKEFFKSVTSSLTDEEVETMIRLQQKLIDEIKVNPVARATEKKVMK